MTFLSTAWRYDTLVYNTSNYGYRQTIHVYDQNRMFNGMSCVRMDMWANTWIPMSFVHSKFQPTPANWLEVSNYNCFHLTDYKLKIWQLLFKYDKFIIIDNHWLISFKQKLSMLNIIKRKAMTLPWHAICARGMFLIAPPMMLYMKNLNNHFINTYH